MDIFATALFLFAAVGLLGSPGPAIACLLAVGRAESIGTGLKYLGGMLVGLSIAAAVCGAGILSAGQMSPQLFAAMGLVAGLYLAYLSYRIATAPVGAVRADRRLPSSPAAGWLVGISNPKAYVAFLSLFASHLLVRDSQLFDNLLKWILIVLVMIAVDTAWLFVGVWLKRANFNEVTERAMNIALGALVFISTLIAPGPDFLAMVR